MRRYVMVGSGVASVAAIEAIRSVDASGEIWLIGDEAQGFYSRPGLAYYLSGELSEAQLYPLREADFHSMNVRRLHSRVVCIDSDQHHIRLRNGSTLSYDRLLIAVGAEAQKLRVPGGELTDVVKLDNLNDARHIIQLARRARSAVVVGGGITALEIVEGLVQRGVKPDYFLRGGRYWSNVLDETESRIVENRLKDDGVKIHYNTEIVEILGRGGRVAGVRIKDGRTFSCDLVAAAIGIRARTELAQASGIQFERGVIVNQTLETSAPDVFAAGDVAQLFDPLTGKSQMDTLWAPAKDQGYIAGLNMAGVTTPYCKAAPFNVTRLADLTTTIIGMVGSGEDQDGDVVGIVRGDSETWRQLTDAIAVQSNFDVNRLRILVGRNTLMGGLVMGDQTLSRPLQCLVGEKVDITPIKGLLLQPGAPLANILADFWAFWKERHAVPTY